MQITLTKEQVKEAFGELRFMGADNCYRYDKDSKKKTEEVEALKLHLGSMKIGNSVDIRLEATELPKIEPYAVVELEEPVYAPYVQRGNFPVLVEKITCKGRPFHHYIRLPSQPVSSAAPVPPDRRSYRRSSQPSSRQSQSVVWNPKES